MLHANTKLITQNIVECLNYHKTKKFAYVVYELLD